MNFVVKMMENQGKCKQPMLNHQGKSLRVTMAWWVSWYEIKYIMQKKTKIRLQNKKLSHTESLQPAVFLPCQVIQSKPFPLPSTPHYNALQSYHTTILQVFCTMHKTDTNINMKIPYTNVGKYRQKLTVWPGLNILYFSKWG